MADLQNKTEAELKAMLRAQIVARHRKERTTPLRKGGAESVREAPMGDPQPFNDGLSAADSELPAFLGDTKAQEWTIEELGPTDVREEGASEALEPTADDFARVPPATPVPRRDAKALGKYFSDRFLKRFLSKSFQEMSVLLGQVVLMAESFRSPRTVLVFGDFLVSDPRDMFVGLWLLANYLLFEAVPQVLFESWAILDFLTQSKFVGLCEQSTVAELSRQTLSIALRKIADSKSGLSFSCLTDLLLRAVERRLLPAEGVVELVVGCQADAARASEQSVYLGRKLTLLQRLAHAVARQSLKALRPGVVLAVRALESTKDSVRQLAFRFLLTLHQALMGRVDFLASILPRYKVRPTHAEQLLDKAAQNQFELDPMQLQNKYTLNSKKKALMAELAEQRLQGTAKGLSEPMSRPKQAEQFVNDPYLRPNPSDFKVKRVAVDQGKVAVKAEMKELAAMRAERLERATVCPCCRRERPEFVRSAAIEAHLVNECPMLVVCGDCSTVVEVRELNGHQLAECPKALQNTRCSHCKLVVKAALLDSHKASAKCPPFPTDSSKVRCPLCAGDLSVTGSRLETTWLEHLSTRGCPGQSRGSGA